MDTVKEFLKNMDLQVFISQLVEFVIRIISGATGNGPFPQDLNYFLLFMRN